MLLRPERRAAWVVHPQRSGAWEKHAAGPRRARILAAATQLVGSRRRRAEPPGTRPGYAPGVHGDKEAGPLSQPTAASISRTAPEAVLPIDGADMEIRTGTTSSMRTGGGARGRRKCLRPPIRRAADHHLHSSRDFLPLSARGAAERDATADEDDEVGGEQREEGWRGGTWAAAKAQRRVPPVAGAGRVWEPERGGAELGIGKGGADFFNLGFSPGPRWVEK